MRFGVSIKTFFMNHFRIYAYNINKAEKNHNIKLCNVHTSNLELCARRYLFFSLKSKNAHTFFQNSTIQKVIFNFKIQ